MTIEEAIESLRSKGLYVKGNDDGGFRGGTQDGTIMIHNGFHVWPQDSKWFVRHEGKGQLSVEHTCDTIEDALNRVEDYIKQVARLTEFS